MSTTRFPLTEAQIVGLFVESVTYGIYLVTLGYCLKVLLCSHEKTTFSLKRAKDIRWAMLIVACLMFTFSTLDVAFGLQHDLEAFIFYTGPGGATEELEQITNWVTVMRSATYLAQTAVADGMLIYRLYIVYEAQVKIVIFPALIWAASLATDVVTIWVEVSTKHDATLNESSLKPWVYSTFSMTLVLNVFVTIMIAWKLWSIGAQAAKIAIVGPGKLLRVSRIMVDSALVYTLSVAVLIATNIDGSNALYPVSDMIIQIIGITFNLIIIRSSAVSAEGNAMLGPMRESYRLPHIDSTIPNLRSPNFDIYAEAFHPTSTNEKKDTPGEWKVEVGSVEVV